MEPPFGFTSRLRRETRLQRWIHRNALPLFCVLLPRGDANAYSPNFGYADVEPEVAALVKAAVDIFAKLDAVVEEVDPGFANPRSIFQTLWQAGAAKLLRGFSPEQQAVIEEGLLLIAKEGDGITLAEYLSA
ncbi:MULTISPECIES: hypothetical protein [unclassified Nostoc]|uniref:hypothetical protein n=1 Tax=unclassified Nostoc TaxID=2593658 RepID=UPI00261FAD0B|nr:hypothetical protein [Nostoc sp. S13]MDF5735176.1 hypothetical protein [Nostoc sp. S13]